LYHAPQASESHHSYTFDRVFDASSDNRQVYEATTKRIVRDVVEGVNGAVFAYGQTSSGKTHTMQGSDDEPGVIPLAIEDVFTCVREGRDTRREFLIRASYLEIYNETLVDLLDEDEDEDEAVVKDDEKKKKKKKLSIREDAERGTYVSGLREEIVTTPQEVMKLLELGSKRRRMGATRMNARSSRSHVIFRMLVESRDGNDDDDSGNGGGVLMATLNLVDLAGSERQSKTGAEGARAVEGAHINKSLTTLGLVIHKLSGADGEGEGSSGQRKHIPYRDSKLTRILQPALGGNSKTSIICAMTSSTAHVDESHSTLRFASRAKRVVNKSIKVNEYAMSTKQFMAMIEKQRAEIEMLRGSSNNNGGIASSSMSAMTPETARTVRAFEDKITRLERDRDALKDKFKADIAHAEQRAANAERESAKALALVATLREDIATMHADGGGDDADRALALAHQLAQARKAREDAEQKLDQERHEFSEEKTKLLLLLKTTKKDGEPPAAVVVDHKHSSSTREQFVKQQETIALQRQRIEDIERTLDDAVKAYEDEVAAKRRNADYEEKYALAKSAYATLLKDHKTLKRQMCKLTEVYAALKKDIHKSKDRAAAAPLKQIN
jgi:centromeric protein E